MVYADQSELFRALAKTLKARSAKSKKTFSPVPNDSLKPNRGKKVPFFQQAVEICKSIKKLQIFLYDVRKDYLDMSRQATGNSGRMTEKERDWVESEAQTLATICSQAITVLKTELNASKEAQPIPMQDMEHRQLVILSLSEYLARTTKAFTKLQNERVRLAAEKQRIASHQTLHRKTNIKEQQAAIEEDLYGEENEELMSSLSDQDKLLLQQENKRLLDEMQQLSDAVKQAERKVLEISRLHHIFTEHVLQQASDLERLYDTTVNTTENVLAGNEKLNKAINNGFDFRVWVLFFLIMCSFSLLFLDWYG